MNFASINILRRELKISWNHLSLLRGNLLDRKYITTNSDDLFKPVVTDEGNRLDVVVPRWPHALNVSYVWLRDHCRCPLCYNQKTFQRINDVHQISLKIRPLSVSAGNESFIIKWPDGHTSEYEYKFLWENIYEGENGTKRKNISTELWTGKTFPHLEQISVSYKELESDGNSRHKVINSLLKHGIGFISEVLPTSDATRSAVEMLFPVKSTFFGEMWSFEDNLIHSDTAYSNEYLGAHNDSTYFSEAVRLQIFHCLKAAPDGGETFLVDGFAIANRLREIEPKTYEFLSSSVFPSEYLGDGQHHVNNDLVFKHDSLTGNISQFRYNIYDRAPLSSIPFEKIDEYYLHLQKLTNLIRMPKYEYTLKLQPGQVLLIDNWRVMHGRRQYSGPRIMGGCYVDNVDFTSRARMLGFKP